MKTIKSSIKIFSLFGLFTGVYKKDNESPQVIQENYDMNPVTEPP